MPRAINRLAARAVATLKTPGMHADGGGLYMRVSKTRSRQWVFIYHWQGKRREMGLGGVDGVNKVGLPEARAAAQSARDKVAQGQDPIAPKSERGAITGDTFGEVAMSLVDSLEEGWKNDKHKAQWRSSLKAYCKPIWNTNVREIDTEDVLACVRPIWADKPETADRVRGRIERVLDASAVLGKRSSKMANPARWKGHLKLILPEKRKLSRGHHAAMPAAEVPTFLATLRQRPAPAARCLELTVLCALRSNEAMGARWEEFDFEEKVWTIPPIRMKGKKGHRREHRVPLVGRALSMMRQLHAERGTSPFVFPSERDSAKSISNMAMEMVMRRMGYGDIYKNGKTTPGTKPNYTVHGFRSTFRDWAGDNTDSPEEVIESALAHLVGSAVRRAYRRGDALEKRRQLMEAWDAYCMGATALAIAAE